MFPDTFVCLFCKYKDIFVGFPVVATRRVWGNLSPVSESLEVHSEAMCLLQR